MIIWGQSVAAGVFSFLVWVGIQCDFDKPTKLKDFHYLIFIINNRSTLCHQSAYLSFELRYLLR